MDLNLSEVDMLKNKWKSLKERFKKDEPKAEEEISEQEQKNYRVYPIFKEMMSLIPSLEKRSTSGNMEEQLPTPAATSEGLMKPTEEGRAASDVSPNPLRSSHLFSPPPKKVQTAASKGGWKKSQDNEDSIFSVLDSMRSQIKQSTTASEKDDHMTMFLKSLEPDLRLIPEENLTKLKMDILSLILLARNPPPASSSTQPQPIAQQLSFHSTSNLPYSSTHTSQKPSSFTKTYYPPNSSSYSRATHSPNSATYTHDPLPSQSSSYSHAPHISRSTSYSYNYDRSPSPSYSPPPSVYPTSHSFMASHRDNAHANTESVQSTQQRDLPDPDSNSTFEEPTITSFTHHTTSETLGSVLQSVSKSSSSTTHEYY